MIYVWIKHHFIKMKSLKVCWRRESHSKIRVRWNRNSTWSQLLSTMDWWSYDSYCSSSRSTLLQFHFNVCEIDHFFVILCQLLYLEMIHKSISIAVSNKMIRMWRRSIGHLWSRQTFPTRSNLYNNLIRFLLRNEKHSFATLNNWLMKHALQR